MLFWISLIAFGLVFAIKGKGEWRRNFLGKILPITQTMEMLFQIVEKMLRKSGKPELAHKIDDFFDTFNIGMTIPGILKSLVAVWK